MNANPLNSVNKKISRRFSFAVVMTILLVMTVFISLDIQASIQYEQKNLKEKMNTFTDIAVNTLTQAIWTFDEKSEKTIANSLMKDAELAKIIIYDDKDQALYSHIKTGPAYDNVNLLRNRTAISYEGVVIAYAETYFTTYYMAHNIEVIIFRRLVQAGVLTLSMVFTVLFISIRITRPIEFLSQEAKLIASGDLSRRIEVENKDEIGILAENLNVMVTALANARASIEKDAIELEKRNREILIYSEELESLVDARTSDYHRANNALMIKNEELEQTLTIFHETQDQLIETKKMAALGTLVAGVAHEINTPLGNGITTASFLQKLQTDLYDQFIRGSISHQEMSDFFESFQEASTILNSNLERAADLVQHFKQLAVNLSSDEKMLFSLGDNIDTVIISLKHEYAGTMYQLNNQCSKDLMMTSYPGMFSQIFTHLIKNSLEHGLKGRHEGHIQIAAHIVEGDQLHIEYADDGIGISEENLARIFDPFYTTSRYSGNVGLGLNIVYNIVTHKLQGSIRCDSEPNKGSRFVMVLPLNPMGE